MAEHRTGSAVRLIACPRPLSYERDRIDQLSPEGLTVGGHMRAAGVHVDPFRARVFVDDRLVEGAEWEQVVPKAGQCVTVRAIPMGGAGGGKTAMRIVAMIAVVALAAAVSGGAAASLLPEGLAMAMTPTAWYAIGTAFAIGGMLAIHGPIPLPRPRLAQA